MGAGPNAAAAVGLGSCCASWERRQGWYQRHHARAARWQVRGLGCGAARFSGPLNSSDVSYPSRTRCWGQRPPGSIPAGSQRSAAAAAGPRPTHTAPANGALLALSIPGGECHAVSTLKPVQTGPEVRARRQPWRPLGSDRSGGFWPLHWRVRAACKPPGHPTRAAALSALATMPQAQRLCLRPITCSPWQACKSSPAPARRPARGKAVAAATPATCLAPPACLQAEQQPSTSTHPRSPGLPAVACTAWLRRRMRRQPAWGRASTRARRSCCCYWRAAAAVQVGVLLCGIAACKRFTAAVALAWSCGPSLPRLARPAAQLPPPHRLPAPSPPSTC